MADIKQLLTEHIDIWTAADTQKKSGRGRASGNAGSVYGVKKLRELILELAVRGKLVPQDSNDEPASELLKRIQAEKAKSPQSTSKRKSTATSTPPFEKGGQGGQGGIGEDEKPFELPLGWEWVRVGSLGDWGAGATPLRSILSYYGGSMPWFKSGELVADFIDTAEESVTDLALKECSLRLNQPGDVLLAMYGATIGKASILKVAGTTNQAVCACTPNGSIFNRYLLLMLKAMKANFVGQGAGGAQPNISREKIIATLTALPPLAEQHRIVAKVDELMVLCDQLEQQHSNAQEAHETLVSQLLATLTHPHKTTPPFGQRGAGGDLNWQRIYAHFDVLFTTEASIDALKQTLLQLAVMGKLVPQDPNDEHASELLKRIQAEKAKLIAEGKLKKEKPIAPISEDEKPFELPQGWEWARLASTGITSTGGTPKTSDTHLFGGNIPFIGPGQISQAGQLLEAEKYLTEDGIAQSTLAENGDILMVCIGGSIGKTLLVNERLTFNQQINCVKPVLVNSSYLISMMNSTIFQQELLLNATGSATPIINRSKWDELLVALAPLEEQHRIVAKVDALMALCDQLKTRIQQANQQQQAIADALVAQAVA